MLHEILEPVFNQLLSQTKTPGSTVHAWMESMEKAAEDALVEMGFGLEERHFHVIEDDKRGILANQRKFRDESLTLQSSLELILEGPRDVSLSLKISVTKADELLTVVDKMNYLAALHIAGTLYPAQHVFASPWETLVKLVQEKINEKENRLPGDKTVFTACASELAWRLQEYVSP